MNRKLFITIAVLVLVAVVMKRPTEQVFVSVWTKGDERATTYKLEEI